MASEGQVAIVTGAVSGIGRVMSLGLLEGGIDVAAVDRNPTSFDTILSAVLGESGRSTFATEKAVDVDLRLVRPRRRGGRHTCRVPDAGDRVRTALRRFRQLVARSPIRRQSLGQLVRQAGIARVGHMQPVGTDAGSRRELLPTIPLLHDLKAAEQADLSASRKVRDQPLHFGGGRAREHPRSVLKVHQDYIDPTLFH